MNSICSICNEDFSKFKFIKLENCNHKYHIRCLLCIINNFKIYNCPKCNTDFTYNENRFFISNIKNIPQNFSEKFEKMNYIKKSHSYMKDRRISLINNDINYRIEKEDLLYPHSYHNQLSKFINSKYI